MGAGASASDQDKIAAYDAIAAQLGALSKGGTVNVADVQKLLAASNDDKAKAAGKLQAIQRGRSTRKARGEQQAAAAQLQAVHRGHAVRKEQGEYT